MVHKPDILYKKIGWYMERSTIKYNEYVKNLFFVQRNMRKYAIVSI